MAQAQKVQAKIFKIELGSKVKDKFTPFKGIVMSRTEHITGCVQYGVMDQKLDKDGNMQGWHFLDEDRLTVVGKGKVLKRSSAGGPMPTCPSKGGKR